MSEKLDWEYLPSLSDWQASTKHGEYYCLRTWAGASVLLFNNEELSRSFIGGHSESKARAQEHYENLQRDIGNLS